MSCRGQRKGLGTGADPSQHCLIIVVPSVVVMSLRVVTRRYNRHVLSRMIAVLRGSKSKKSSIRTESFAGSFGRFYVGVTFGQKLDGGLEPWVVNVMVVCLWVC